MAEIIGLDKITNYMSQFDFKKIKLSRGSDAVFVRKIKEGETEKDLIDAFSSWVDDFITPGNFKEYKLELLGSYSEDPNARLSPVVKVAVAFSGKETTATPGVNVGMSKSPTTLPPEISIDKYVALATENAKLEAQLERLEEKMDELLADDEDSEDESMGSPTTLGEAVNQALIGKLDTIVDVVLGYLANNTLNRHTQVAGVDPGTYVPKESIQPIIDNDNWENEILDVADEFRKINPHILEDLKRLLNLAKTNKPFFDMLIKQLRSM